jgi:hypothetical protein
LRIKPCGFVLKLIELCGVKGCTFPSLTEWQQSFSSPLPSPHAMSGCFLEDYWKIFGRRIQVIYKKTMQNTSVDEVDAWLSCDHTFASAGM